MTVMMMVLMVMVSAMMLTMRMMVKQMMMSMTMGIRMLGCQCYSSTISHRYTSSTRQKSANKQIHLRTDSCIACVLIRCISEQVLALRVYYTVHKQTDSFLNRFLHYVFITRHTSKHIHFRTDSSLLHGTQGNRFISEQILAIGVYYTVHKETDSSQNRILHYVCVIRYANKQIHLRTDSCITCLLYGTQANIFISEQILLYYTVHKETDSCWNRLFLFIRYTRKQIHVRTDSCITCVYCTVQKETKQQPSSESSIALCSFLAVSLARSSMCKTIEYSCECRPTFNNLVKTSKRFSKCLQRPLKACRGLSDGFEGH